MKKSLICFVLFIVLCSFIPINYCNAQVQFFNHYGTSNYGDQGIQLIQKSNGNYYITGITTENGPGGDIVLMCVDSLGNAVWTKEYSGINGDCPYSMTLSNEGGFGLVGYTTSYGLGHQDGIFIKTDSTGNLLRTVTYGTAPSDDAMTCLLKTNSGYLLGGYTYLSSTSIIYNTDSLGNIIWSAELLPFSSDQSIMSAYQFNDNSFLIMRTYPMNISCCVGYSVTLIKISPSGSVVWTKDYSAPGFQVILAGAKMIHTSDNGFIITGATKAHAIGADYDVLVIKTDSAGNFMWSKTYGGTYREVGSDIIEIQSAEGNGYVITGWTNSSGAGAADAFILRTDGLGNLIWGKTYGRAWNDVASSIIQTRDGGFAITGRTSLAGAAADSIDILLIKTDALGNSPCNSNNWMPIVQDSALILTHPTYTTSAYGLTTFPIVPVSDAKFYSEDFCIPSSVNNTDEKKQFNIHPNPAHNTFSISFGKLEIENAELKITDVTGRVVLTQKINSPLSVINFPVSAGVYFVRIGDGERRVTQKLVVE
jgi:hypothetical protein